MTKKIKLVIFALMAFILLTIFMFVTTPSETDYDKWANRNYGIECNSESICYKDNFRILKSNMHHRHAGFFMTIEKNIEDLEGSNDKEISIRVLGVFNKIIPMENNWLWEILN